MYVTWWFISTWRGLWWSSWRRSSQRMGMQRLAEILCWTSQSREWTLLIPLDSLCSTTLTSQMMASTLDHIYSFTLASWEVLWNHTWLWLGCMASSFVPFLIIFLIFVFFTHVRFEIILRKRDWPISILLSEWCLPVLFLFYSECIWLTLSQFCCSTPVRWLSDIRE